MLPHEKMVGIDVLRAEELQRMSAKERECVLNDIHCCPDTPFVDAQSIRLRMDEFELALQDELASDVDFGAAYRLAHSLDSSYVLKSELRLAFLRAERFHPRQAVRRFLAFFREKLMLWGSSRLTCEITLSDFDSKDMEVLRSGKVQLLPQKDQSGRQIMSHVIADQVEADHKSVLRAIYYLTLAAMEEEENQNMGLVGLTYHSPRVVKGKESSSTMDDCTLSFPARLATLRNVLPVRFASLHYCIQASHPFVTKQISREIRALDCQTRARCRVHSGASIMELHFLLSSFGISPQNLPVSVLGTLKTGSHNAWLRHREAKETIGGFNFEPLKFPSEDSSALISDQDDYEPGPMGGTTLAKRGPLPPSVLANIDISSRVLPSSNDVLFGRGKAKDHPGNILLHNLINERRLCYEMAPKWGKTEIAEEIVSIIQEKSGRFLKFSHQKGERIWVIVSKDGAREKVAHTFRSKRSR